jgi:nitroimidazol reductase NimA-like FMN-containing flavoprotein (pyridoxamine 5'-phosphate oxidase superfamily)
MPPVSGAWSHEQLKQFLEDALVPLRLGCHHPSGGLWMLSLWYQYDDESLLCSSSRDSNIVRFLRENDEVSFELSTNRPPYMGVRGNGTTTLEPDEQKQVLKDLLQRYLGGTDSELASMLLAGDREEIVIQIDPERLYTWDFTERMASATDSPATREPEPESPQEGSET